MGSLVKVNTFTIPRTVLLSRRSPGFFTRSTVTFRRFSEKTSILSNSIRARSMLKEVASTKDKDDANRPPSSRIFNWKTTDGTILPGLLSCPAIFLPLFKMLLYVLDSLDNVNVAMMCIMILSVKLFYAILGRLHAALGSLGVAFEETYLK